MRFSAVLFRFPGPAGWTFVPLPTDSVWTGTHPWGRTPVRATVNGHTWDTSVWRDRRYGALLAVPKRVRGSLGHGDEVTVDLELR